MNAVPSGIAIPSQPTEVVGVSSGGPEAAWDACRDGRNPPRAGPERASNAPATDVGGRPMKTICRVFLPLLLVAGCSGAPQDTGAGADLAHSSGADLTNS